MSTRRLRRYVEDLLRGRRPRPFPADEHEAAEVRAAIALRAARPGSGAPREDFVAALHRRLATEFGTAAPSPATRPPTRRRVVQVASVAAAAAAVGGAGGAALDHALTGTDAGTDSGSGAAVTLRPNSGTWHTVATSADLTEGTVLAFDAGTLNGFVERTGGRLSAVSGVCTHLGCRLRLNAAATELDCPCHNAAFALGGELLRHQLPTAPAPLPRLAVREVDDAVQVFLP